MKGFNSLYFRNMLDFFFEFIPQITLLLVLFGWMDALIIGKWTMEKNINTVYDSDTSTEFNQVHLSPAIITTMIDIFLAFGNNKNADGTPKYNYVFPTAQQTVSVIFLVIAFLCVPLMLAVKPMILKRQLEHHDHHHHENDVQIKVEQVPYGSNVEKTYEEKQLILKNTERFEQIEEIIRKEGASDAPHSFGDIFIHQLIETIEFVLGSISNTASYLRLWALSLAHSQLAAVFLEQILKMAFVAEGTSSCILLFFLFFMFFSFTFGVLMCMDTLECFLHTLRLHWVEFQNKFFKGTGYRFTPFSFETVLAQEMKRK